MRKKVTLYFLVIFNLFSCIGHSAAFDADAAGGGGGAGAGTAARAAPASPISIDILRSGIEGLRTWTDEFERNISALAADRTNRFVLVIGGTKNGKSSLLHWLAGCDLKVVYDDINVCNVLVPTKELRGNMGPVEIDPKPESQTFYPNLIKIEGIYFVDCPGFNDTRDYSNGMPLEICTMYLMKLLYERVKIFSILLVQSEESILDGAQEKFIGELNFLNKIFELDEQPFVNNTALVITKTSKIKRINQLHPPFRSKLDLIRKTLSPRLQELLENFVRSEDRMELMPSPPEELVDKLYASEDLTARKESILTKVRSLTNISDPKVQVVLMRDASRSYLQREYTRLNTQLKRILMEDYKALMIERIAATIETLHCYEQVKNELRALHEGIISLKERIGDTLNAFITNMPHLLGFIRTREIESFERSINALSKDRGFIRSVWPGIIEEAMDWTSPLNDIDNILLTLLTAHVTSINGSVGSVKGYLVGISDILDVLGRHLPNLRALNVQVWDTLFLDKNLSLPGVHVTFIAPRWKLEGDITIDLTGKTALEYDALVADGDGLPGRPGGNGGHFYGKAISIEPHNHSLIIDTRGGKGGKGQNGAAGSRGRDGEDGNMRPVREKDRHAFIAEEEIKGSFLSNLRRKTLDMVAVRTTYQSVGTLGTHGENGKKGGRGGEKGIDGIVELDIDKKNESLLYTLGLNEEPFQVRHGLPGEGGDGGRNGQTFIGRYIKEVPKDEWEVTNRRKMITPVIGGIGTSIIAGGSAWGIGSAIVGLVAATPIGWVAGIVGGVVGITAGVVYAVWDGRGWETGDPKYIDGGRQPDGISPTVYNEEGAIFRPAYLESFQTLKNNYTQYLATREITIPRNPGFRPFIEFSRSITSGHLDATNSAVGDRADREVRSRIIVVRPTPTTGLATLASELPGAAFAMPMVPRLEDTAIFEEFLAARMERGAGPSADFSGEIRRRAIYGRGSAGAGSGGI